MRPKEFIESTFFNELSCNEQALLQYMIEKLGNIDYVIIKRNEPVLAFKVRALYESNPRSQANIATIRLKKGFITIGPYKNRNENKVVCRSREDISDSLIEEIKNIYREKGKIVGK